MNSDAYEDQLTGAVLLWAEAEQNWQRDRDELSAHPAAAIHVSFESEILDLDREIKHCDEEAGKILGRVHHLDREKSEALTIIHDEVHEISGGAFFVPGVPDDTKEEK